MSRAVITIDYHHYLVKDPKKALALVEILNGAQRVQSTGYNEFTLSNELIDVSMEALSAKVKILETKPTKLKK